MKKIFFLFAICFFILDFFGSGFEDLIVEKSPYENDQSLTKKSFPLPETEIQKTSQTIIDKLSDILETKIVDNLIKNLDKSGNAKLSNMVYNEKNIEAQLLPKTQISKKVFEVWQNKSCVFMVENLYLYKKQKPANNSSFNEMERISDILHSVSTMQGIEYYSASRKKMRTLYEKSYAVNKISSGNKISYQKIDDDFNAEKQLVLQKDLTFGEFIYLYSYFQEADGVGFVCENTENLKYSIFSLVNPYEMNVALSIVDLDDYLLAYANTRANFPRLAGIDKKLQNSFSTRADALYNWFIKNYEQQGK